MSCPKCGSSARQPIGPGFFRCTNIVTVQRAGPGGVNRQLGPPLVEVSEPCDTEYHEGASTGPLCSVCETTYSIGICGKCSNPVCGDHSALFEDRRTCQPCRAEALAARRNVKAAAERELNLAATREQERWFTEVRTLVAGDPPAVALCRFAQALPPEAFVFKSPAELAAKLGVPVPTTSDFARWFATQAASLHVEPSTSVRRIPKKLLGRLRYVNVPAWKFGSRKTFKSLDAMSAHFLPLIVLSDGTFEMGGAGGRGTLDGHAEFSVAGLSSMARALNLAKLPPQPLNASGHLWSRPDS